MSICWTFSYTWQLQQQRQWFWINRSNNVICERKKSVYTQKLCMKKRPRCKHCQGKWIFKSNVNGAHETLSCKRHTKYAEKPWVVDLWSSMRDLYIFIIFIFTACVCCKVMKCCCGWWRRQQRLTTVRTKVSVCTVHERARERKIRQWQNGRVAQNKNEKLNNKKSTPKKISLSPFH
jgi:hypothetical protein